MSLQEELKETLKDLKYDKLIVTKGVNYKGRPGVRVTFFLEDKIFFETLITDDLGLDNTDKAQLVRINAQKALKNYEAEKGDAK